MKKMTRAALMTSAAIIALPVVANAQSAGDEILVIGDYTRGGDVKIDSQTLDRRAPSTMQQIFAGETAVQGGGASTASQKIFVHGIEQSQLNVTVDGVRQGSAVYHHQTNAILDPALYKSVEIKPGVATADDGPHAVAGSIKFETKDARDLLSPNDSIGGSASVAWESNGARFRETGSVYGTIGRFDYLAAGSGYQGDDHKDGDNVEVKYSAPNVSDFLGKVGYTSSGGHRFEVSGQVTSDQNERLRRPDFGGLVFGPPNPVEDTFFIRQAYTLQYEDQSGDGVFTPSAQLNYQFSKTDTDLLRGAYESFSGKLNGDVSVGLGVVSLGADFYSDENKGGADGAGRLIRKEEADNVGIYAQARLQPLEWASLSIGARGDHQWFTGMNGEEFNDGGLSANATIEISPVDWLTFDAGASHVWGGYTFGESGLYGFSGTPDYTGFTPSTSNNYRGGLTVAHAGFKVGASLFLTQIDDASDRGGTTRGVTADLETKGVDAFAGYTGERFYGTVKYTFADVTEDGATPSTTNFFKGQPVGHVFGIEAGFSPIDGLRLGGDAQIALENEDYVGVSGLGSTTGVALPAYEVVNIHAEYQPPQLAGVSLRASVNNLLDETYLTRAADGGGQDAIIVPLNEPGRSFGFSAKVEF